MNSSKAKKNITFYIPGLLGPVSHYDDLPVNDKPELPSLLKLLSVANQKQHESLDYYESLFELFSIQHLSSAQHHLSKHHLSKQDNVSADLPLAAICYVLDTGRVAEGYVMFAEPVHLRPDRDQLVMLAADELSISDEEAKAFVAEINMFFDQHDPEREWTLEAVTAKRWYIHFNSPPDLQTVPVRQILGYSVHDAMPKGDDAAKWLAITNEIQMLLHASQTNITRDSDGEMRVNSVWLSCGGSVNAYTVTNDADGANSNQWDCVWSDDYAAMAMAHATQTKRRDKLNTLSQLFTEEGDKQLVIIDDLLRATHMNDLFGWLSTHKQLEEFFFEPLTAAIRDSQINAVTIQTENHSFEITRHSLWKFWKTVKSLNYFMLKR